MGEEGMNSVPQVRFDQTSTAENQVATVIFIVPAAIIAVFAGGVAAFCVARGGDLEWTTRFWVFVKVSCKFR